jgi:HAD superfamily hydrolase (TIGR01450 family)
VTTVPALICDLDGVVWLADHAIAGSAEAIARVRAAGGTVLFVTNNSSVPVSEVEAKLGRFGIPAEGDVLTSAQAAAQLLAPGERAFLCAGPGAAEALLARGVELVDGPPADAVVVGFHRTFDYEALRRAVGAVRAGARLIGTNDDSTYPTPDGPIPGGGAILAAVAVGSGVAPIVAGKPYAAMAALVRARLGETMATAVMVGDRADTDGRFAVELGCRFGLVLSGVTSRSDLPIDPTPDLIADDLSGLVATLL